MREMMAEKQQIKKIFKHVSIEMFITYFYTFEEYKYDSSNKEIIEEFANNSEIWTRKASSGRASKGKKIFELGLEVEALEYIINGANVNKLTPGIKEKAQKIYTEYIQSKTFINSKISNENTYNINVDTLEEVKERDDIEQIENNETLSKEQKTTLVKIRLGQGPYRRKLIEYWGGCSICGCTQTDILIASHIKPWSKCNQIEKYDVYNGLLLTPNYDKLFDNYFISFDLLGKIMISNSLSDDDLKKLGISKDDKISEDKLTIKLVTYLKEHNYIFFEK